MWRNSRIISVLDVALFPVFAPKEQRTEADGMVDGTKAECHNANLQNDER
jgi:hypothetical protein